MSDDLIYGIRNDVDELLVARDSLAKRISELENVLKTLNMDNKAYKIAQEHNWLVYKDKLNELEKIVIERHKLGVKGEYYFSNKQIAIEKNEGEIAELRNQIQNNSVADLNHYNELKEDNKNRSVETTKLMQVYIDLKITLRDFFWALDDYFESKDQKKFQKIFRKLHKKLDSRTDWIKDMADGPQQEIEWRRREKVSGGKKQ